ncbi:hypothetical protein Tco_0162525 [Tanacetum coccineum]
MEQPQSSTTQQITLADQLVHSSKFQEIGKCNNMAVLPNIPYPMECRIVGQLLIDDALSYALTATSDVPIVYIQTVKQVPNHNETIHFMVDKQEITYTVDTFCVTLKIPVETPEQPFIPPASLEYIQPFLKIVGYQGLVDKVRKLLSKDYEEKYGGVEVPMIQLEPVESTQGTHRTPRATKTPNPDDVVQKKKGKHAAGKTSSPRPSLKVRIRHQKSSTTIPPPRGGVEKIVEGDDEESYASEFVDTILLDEEDFDNRIKPKSHKDNLEEVDDDDDETKDEKKDVDDDNKDDDQDDHAFIRNQRMGSSKIRTKKMQTPTPSPPRSPKKDLSPVKANDQELTVSVSSTPATSSQRRSKPISRRYTHIPGALHRICRRQGFMIQQMEKKYVTNRDFQVKLCLEHKVKDGDKVVKKELIVALRCEIYFVKFIINPEEDDIEPEVILGRSFMRLIKGIVDFRNGIITIYPELDPFLDNSEESENFEDDWELILDGIDFGDIPELEETSLPPFVCKMGKSARKKKRPFENYQMNYSYKGLSLTNKKPLTQEEAAREAIAIDIYKRISILEEARPIIKTMTYSDRYKKILDSILLDKLKLDGEIKSKEEAIKVGHGRSRSIEGEGGSWCIRHSYPLGRKKSILTHWPIPI